MRTHGLMFTWIAVLAGVLAFGTGALAEKPPHAGNGSGEDSGLEPPDYGDLFILYRDTSGLPILTQSGDGNIGGCVQPLAKAECEGCGTVDDPEHTQYGLNVILPVDDATCAVMADYVTLTQEVDFGRMNEARSTEEVFLSQLEDATVRLATAGCVTLDPAGRLVASSYVDPDPTVEDDEYVDYSTVDSPLQNLAMYRQLMLDGTLGDDIDLRRDWLAAAATNLGAASDKAGFVGVDLVVYLNEIMGLTAESANAVLGRNCIMVREEVTGVVENVQKCFLDYTGFSYTRSATFGALPDPAYIPGDDPQAGIFEYLDELSPAPNPTFTIEYGQILAAVPELNADQSYQGTDIGAFAMAADDSRAVIDFMHNWPVPGDYETEVPCAVEADVFYDVSISDASGLQVPKRMVAGTEGREGVLTVTNAGPARAVGSVSLTRTADIVLTTIDGTEELFAPADGYAETFELPAGHSKSWTFFFSVAEPMEIEWIATIDAEHDVNASNDSVTEYTTVARATGGGGDH